MSLSVILATVIAVAPKVIVVASALANVIPNPTGEKISKAVEIASKIVNFIALNFTVKTVK